MTINMQKVEYIENPTDFLNYVSKKIKQTDIVLDIGSGINPQKYIKPVVHICAEPYDQYAQHLLEKIWNKHKFFIILKQKWDEVIKIIPENGVDTIITLDVIEHLEKSEWEDVLKKSIPLAKKQLIMFTPYWFLPQVVPDGMKDAWWLDGTEWQRHKSWWTEKDFWDDWDIYICPEFHFKDAITWETHIKPYWAMFAILNKENKSIGNIYSLIRSIKSFFIYTLPLYFKSNKIFYNPILKYLYRNIILKIIKK